MEKNASASFMGIQDDKAMIARAQEGNSLILAVLGVWVANCRILPIRRPAMANGSCTQ